MNNFLLLAKSEMDCINEKRTTENQLRYIVIESITDGKYYIVDTFKEDFQNNLIYDYIEPFGYCVENTLSMWNKLNNNHPNHDELVNLAEKNLSEDSINHILGIYERNKAPLEKLFLYLRDYKKNSNDKDFKSKNLKTWKYYQFIMYYDYLDDLTLPMTSDDEESFIDERAMIHSKVFCVPFMNHVALNDSIAGSCYFVTEHLSDMFPNDLYNVLVYGYAKHFKQCERCGDLLFSNGLKVRYCRNCRNISQTGAYKYDKRNSDPVQKMNKKIHDYISKTPYFQDNKEKLLAEFLNESDYYKKRCKGVDVELNNSYDNSIAVTSSYIEWLNQKYEALRQENALHSKYGKGKKTDNVFK